MSNLAGVRVAEWATRNDGADSADDFREKPTQLDALQALIAFSALHDQIRRRRALAARHSGFEAPIAVAEFEAEEQFVLDEVLQLVAQRAVAITGADGLAIALAENNEIVLRAAAGTICPDLGQRIDRNSSFSGACFRTAQVFTCDDTETDPRVNLEACRKLGTRSMVAVPLCGRRRVIGVIEAFCSWPFGFNDSDVRNLTLLAELVLAALKPEDEDRFAKSAEIAETKLEAAKGPVPAAPIERSKGAEAQKAEPAKARTEAALSVPPAATPSAPLATAPNSPLLPSPQSSPVGPAASAPLATALRVGADKASAPTETDSSQSATAHPEPGSAPGSSTQTEATLVQPESHLVSKRQWMLVLLVCIVVGTAFAAGVWWKLKSAQIGNQMVQTSRLPQSESVAPGSSTAPAVTPNGDNNGAGAATSPAPPSEAAIPAGSSSTPQEVSKYPKVTGVRHWSSAEASTIVLDLEDQVQYEPGHLSNPDRFYFDLRDTQLSAELQGKSFDGDSLLSRIRIAQPAPGMTRIVLEARPGAALSRPQVSLERDPYRLVIEVSKAGASPKGAINLFPNAPETEKNKLAIVIPPPTKEDLQLRARVPKLRIAVDAGHGGWDLGTVGRRGLLEKDLVLEIAQRLGKLLENRLGSEVIYTRPDDNYIPLDDRAQIANQAQADLFISVHANYSDLPSARGVETYYTNFFSAPGSKEATLQNVDTSSMAGNLKNSISTLSPSELHERIDQSRRLAASVQRSLYGTLSVQNPGLRDRGVKEAGFVVLTESAMPGILAEVSFVSSPTDEQKLQSDGYREKIAEALYKGIARYAISSRGVKMAAKQVGAGAQ